MLELVRLHPDHEPAVLEFERSNRAYFAQSINDRGDEFFQEFAQLFRGLLSEQEAEVCACYVLVEAPEVVVGRFNLSDLVGGTAVVGYRVAQRVSGRGVATTGLHRLCRLAGEEHGLRTLRAAVSDQNVASQRVLTKSGFVAVAPAVVGGQPGWSYERTLPGR